MSKAASAGKLSPATVLGALGTVLVLFFLLAPHINPGWVVATDGTRLAIVVGALMGYWGTTIAARTNPVSELYVLAGLLVVLGLLFWSPVPGRVLEGVLLNKELASPWPWYWFISFFSAVVAAMPSLIFALLHALTHERGHVDELQAELDAIKKEREEAEAASAAAASARARARSRMFNLSMAVVFLLILASGAYYRKAIAAKISPFWQINTPTAMAVSGNTDQKQKLLVSALVPVQPVIAAATSPSHSTPQPTQSPPCSVVIRIYPGFWQAEGPKCLVGKVQWSRSAGGPWYNMDRSGDLRDSESQDGRPNGPLHFLVNRKEIFSSSKAVDKTGSYEFKKQ